MAREMMVVPELSHIVGTTQYREPQVDTLLRHVEKAAAIRKSDVHMFTVMDRRYVVKFDRPGDRSYRRAWASAVLCAVLFGRFPSPKRLLPGNVRHEALRLRKLGEQGVRVPKVYLVGNDHVVLEHSGETVETVLKKLRPGKQKTQFLWTVIDDLIEFHLHGHWHGGAQVRNLTLKNGLIYRIDFEEQIGAALPLPLAQAFDVFLAFNSIMSHLHDDQQEIGVQLLSHYLGRVRSAQVVQVLKRLKYWLNHLRRIEPYLGSRLRGKHDLQRSKKFSLILNEALAPY